MIIYCLSDTGLLLRMLMALLGGDASHSCVVCLLQIIQPGSWLQAASATFLNLLGLCTKFST